MSTFTASHDLEFGSSPKQEHPQKELRIRHSQHEEFILVTLGIGAHQFELGSRSHHYLVLELARILLQDLEAGIRSSEAGWIHIRDLGERVMVTPATINVQLFRLRRQVGRAGAPPEFEIIERRRGCGELRLGVKHVVIARL